MFDSTDIPLDSDGKTPSGKEQAQRIEYRAELQSDFITGEVRLVVGSDGLLILSPLNALEVSYADMILLTSANYTVLVKTLQGEFSFMRMGSWLEPFFEALAAAYNKKVLKALFVSESPLLTAKGQYHFVEGSKIIEGAAPIQVYKNCVCVLPNDTNARRIPLCFLTNLEKSDYEHTLIIDNEERYTLKKLGYDSKPFEDAVNEQLRNLREQTLEALGEVDPSLSTQESFSLVQLVTQGAAAPLNKLRAISPSFVAALEKALRASRIAESYTVLSSLCAPEHLYIGFKKDNTPSVCGEDTSETAENSEAGEGLSGELMLWLIAVSPQQDACAVEFAGDKGDASATFIYHFDEHYDVFARRLNKALEAIDFKREVIRLTDEELLDAKYSSYRMAVQRNNALSFVRSCFTKRIIHRSSWEQQLMDAWKQGY